MDLSVVPYGEMGRGGVEVGLRGGAGDWKAAEAARGGGGRYRECMRNHAAAIGGQAYDGCGEFMPGGDGGSLEALKCAACGCHRNFHRREGASASPSRPLLLSPPGFPAFLPHPVQVPVPYHQIRHHPPSASAYDGSRAGSETPPRREDERQAAAARARKRHRTKFTAEQKEKMQAFAERLGWRIQKHDDVALQEFCVEIGVKRHVLKVWMHNNKTSHSPSASASASKPDATAAAPPIRV